MLKNTFKGWSKQFLRNIKGEILTNYVKKEPILLIQKLLFKILISYSEQKFQLIYIAFLTFASSISILSHLQFPLNDTS